jgi:hypothetical protein
VKNLPGGKRVPAPGKSKGENIMETLCIKLAQAHVNIIHEATGRRAHKVRGGRQTTKSRRTESATPEGVGKNADANQTRRGSLKTAHQKKGKHTSKEENEYQRKLRDAYRLGPWRKKSPEERWAELRGAR